ncbi:hypothetical protein OAU50_03485 [Planctomycetota bacterium]|nr:hypothetical protein [Planctomycetota bacterium]
MIDAINHTVRKIDPAGLVSTLAGSAGAYGTADGIGAAARFQSPRGVAVDVSGNVYVADTVNHTIRKITPTGVVSTLAGTAGATGGADGIGAAARFTSPFGVAADTSGNVYVADTGNNVIRKIAPGGVVSTLAGTAGASGSADGTGAAARFASPFRISVDSSGNLYVADKDNHTIRKIDPAGVVSTLAGTAGLAGSADGNGAAARFNNPNDIAFDASGNFYVVDAGNHSIRKCVPTLAVSAVIDKAIGVIGAQRQLQAFPNTATSWRWEWIRHPSASTAALSSITAPNPTFTPDVEDIYVWRLYASSPSGASITDVTLTVNNGIPVVQINTTLPYSASADTVYLDANATIQDADSTGFDTGNLTIASTGMSEDQLSIDNTGVFRVNGVSVEYDATGAFAGSEFVVGTLTGDGSSGSNLIVTFNALCTVAIAQELLRNIQYENLATVPDTSPRFLKVSVTDESAQVSDVVNVLLFPPTSVSSSVSVEEESGCSAHSSGSRSLWILFGLMGLVCITRARRHSIQN